MVLGEDVEEEAGEEAKVEIEEKAWRGGVLNRHRAVGARNAAEACLEDSIAPALPNWHKREGVVERGGGLLVDIKIESRLGQAVRRSAVTGPGPAKLKFEISSGVSGRHRKGTGSTGTSQNRLAPLPAGDHAVSCGAPIRPITRRPCRPCC